MAHISSLRLLSLLWLTMAVKCGATEAEPAWNGYTTPDAIKPTVFTPFYVPPGAIAYDSASPLIVYSGVWTESFSRTYIDASTRWTTAPHSSASFTFTGSGIEWFGSTSKTHGMASVYINGELVQRVDASSSKPLNQQRLFWLYDMPHGKHTIKIVNLGFPMKYSRLDIDAFVVIKKKSEKHAPGSALHHASPNKIQPRGSASGGEWTLLQKGTTGVHAMQLAVISDTHALIIDKVEHNPLTISGRPAWAALYNLEAHTVKPLKMQSNSFCAGGTFLSNGTLINVGGNPVVESHTASADFGDTNGLQAIRLFDPCDSASADSCVIREDHARIRMASPRWYNTVLRLPDGSAMIVGGSKRGGWINNATVNNPSVEYFPPKNIRGSNGLPITISFLVDTLNSNLFPIAFVLPDSKVFMAANKGAMIYDWKSNKERRLPDIPHGVRVTYPMTGTGLLLPLSHENNYTPEILLCGGSNLDDKKPGHELSSQGPASAQCSRMVLTDDGISAGWIVEQMPEARTMPDAVLLPTGKVLIVNGAGSGISGYSNVRDQVGTSNADHPVLRPVLYDPNGNAGARFSTQGMPTSNIPRLYHSVATLTPSGEIMIAGSNPNLDRSEVKYPTEYRVEWLRPPYMDSERPEILKLGYKIRFGQTIRVEIKTSKTVTASNIKVALMDLGFVTHSVHANSRLVYLKNTLDADAKKISVIGPPNGDIYPPGPGWLYVLVDGVPSRGSKIMVGDGFSPEVDEAALKNVLEKTRPDQ